MMGVVMEEKEGKDSVVVWTENLSAEVRRAYGEEGRRERGRKDGKGKGGRIR